MTVCVRTEIKMAFKKFALQFHPDKNFGASEKELLLNIERCSVLALESVQILPVFA